jgi:broad specificity phosphatase PhoE
MAAKIMIIRHGEKPTEDGRVHGVDESGSHDSDELSVQGWQRAGALIRFFAPLNGAFAHRALATPDAIYACAPGDRATSVRSEHTVAPLAQFLNQSVDLRYGKGEEDQLVRAVAATQGIVLIAWEHNRIPNIVAGIAADDSTFPKKWHDSRFDLVWVLDRQPDAGWKLTQVPQLILPGDRREIIQDDLFRTGRTF